MNIFGRFLAMLFGGLFFAYASLAQDIKEQDVFGKWKTVDTAFTSKGETLVLNFSKSGFMSFRYLGIDMGVYKYRLVKKNGLQYLFYFDIEFSPYLISGYDSTQLRRVKLVSDTLTIENFMVALPTSAPAVMNQFIQSKR